MSSLLEKYLDSDAGRDTSPEVREILSGVMTGTMIGRFATCVAQVHALREGIERLRALDAAETATKGAGS